MIELRIIVFANSRPTYTGGAEKDFYALCQRLSQDGNTVLAIFPAIRGTPDKDIINFECVSLPGPNIRGYSLAIAEIMRIIKTFNPDVIHLLDGLSPTDAFLLLTIKISIRKPVFVNVIAFYRFIAFNFLARLTLPLYVLSDGVICSNPILKKSVLRWTLKRAKILDFYSVYLDVPKPSLKTHNVNVNGKCKLLFVGLLDSNHLYKGFDLLVEALKYLHSNDAESYKKVELKIVGDGELRNYYEEEIKKSGLTGISFKGRISEDDLNNMYRNVDGFILPSKRKGEGFGKVVLEALMNGIPVLVSRYAGAAFLVSEYNVGMLIDPYDSENFAKKIVEFIDDIEKETYQISIEKFQEVFSHASEDAYGRLIHAYAESIKHQRK